MSSGITQAFLGTRRMFAIAFLLSLISVVAPVRGVAATPVPTFVSEVKINNGGTEENTGTDIARLLMAG